MKRGVCKKGVERVRPEEVSVRVVPFRPASATAGKASHRPLRRMEGLTATHGYGDGWRLETGESELHVGVALLTVDDRIGQS